MEQRRIPTVRSDVTDPERKWQLWAVLLIGTVAALVPNDPSVTSHRAVAVLGSVLAATIAGTLIGKWAGLGLAVTLGPFHLVVRELFGPAEEAFPPLMALYVFVLGGLAWLSGVVTETLRVAASTSETLAKELAESDRRQRIVQLISRVGAELSSHGTESETVRAALTDLCAALDLDVIIIRRNEDLDGGLISTIEAWITQSGSDRALRLNDGVLDWRRLPNMRDLLSSGRPCVFSSLDELPITDRVTLSSGVARLESVLNLPVMDGSRWLGHTALGSRSRGKQWSPDDVASLEILTEMISNTWRRDRQTQELMDVIDAKDRAIRAQDALTEGTRLLLAHDLEEPLEKTLGLVMDALDGEAAYIELFEDDPDQGLMSRPIEHLYRDPAKAVESVTWPLSWSPVAAHKLLSGQPSIFGSSEEETSSDPQRIEPYEEAPLAAECNYPIVMAGATRGFVGVGTFSPREWTSVDMTVMQSFALMLTAYFEREAAMRQLEDLVAAKDRFIASVSHELRTPLAVVVGLAAELEDNDEAFTPEERAEFLGMIRRQSTEVSDIIDDLLVSTRIAETELTIMESEFSLDALIREVLRDLPSEVSGKVADVDLTPVEVIADPLRTRQIVRNLITNAHRYGGPNVYVTVRSDQRRGILEVADDGDGVAEERRDEIFEAYHTSGGERIVTAAIGGLGLTVSRQLAQLMGGDVTYVHGELPRFQLSLRSVETSLPPQHLSLTDSA